MLLQRSAVRRPCPLSQTRLLCSLTHRARKTLAHSSATLSPTCSHALALRRRSRLALGDMRLVPSRSEMVLSTLRQRTGMPAAEGNVWAHTVPERQGCLKEATPLPAKPPASKLQLLRA